MRNVIEIKNAKIYQNNTLILDDINFELGESEFVYLIGRTGSGKSSLLKTLYGELLLTEGEGVVAGGEGGEKGGGLVLIASHSGCALARNDWKASSSNITKS